MTSPLILIVEDDKNISRATRAMLELDGYRVYTAQTLAEGKALTEKYDPDLTVLDILLPDGNGLDYCRTLRERGGGGRILFLSALNTHEDVVSGLRAGGDDYLAKPYLTDELLLRIKALLRRGRIGAEQSDRTGPFCWNRVSRQVSARGKDLLLTPREYAILALLCAESDRWFSPEEIYRAVWNAEPLDNLSAVHNHIYTLRQKLAGSGAEILSARTRGYRVSWNGELRRE
jgi:DNA-binding response OmpR family regulator